VVVPPAFVPEAALPPVAAPLPAVPPIPADSRRACEPSSTRSATACGGRRTLDHRDQRRGIVAANSMDIVDGRGDADQPRLAFVVAKAGRTTTAKLLLAAASSRDEED
jgi:hypothetical protein